MSLRRTVQMVVVPFVLVIAFGITAAAPASAKPKQPDHPQSTQSVEDGGAKRIRLAGDLFLAIR